MNDGPYQPKEDTLTEPPMSKEGIVKVGEKEFHIQPLNMGDRKKIKQKCQVDIIAFKDDVDGLGDKVACILEYGFAKAGMTQEEMDSVPLGELLSVQEVLFKGMAPRPI